jgi:hypothetical protein
MMLVSWLALDGGAANVKLTGQTGMAAAKGSTLTVT